MHASEFYIVWRRLCDRDIAFAPMCTLWLLDCVFPSEAVTITGCGILTPNPRSAEVACEVAQYFVIESADPRVGLAVCDWVRSHLVELCKGASQKDVVSFYFQFFSDRLISVPLVGSTDPVRDQLITAFCLVTLCELGGYSGLDTIYCSGTGAPADSALLDVSAVGLLMKQIHEFTGIGCWDCDYSLFVQRAIENGYLARGCISTDSDGA